MKRLSILVSAFALSPNRGSEFGVGWNLVTRLAARHDVTVLYGDIGSQETYRREVEEWLEAHGPVTGLKFIYVRQGAAGRLMVRLCKVTRLFFLYYSAYYCWQRQAYRTAKSLLLKESFDACHQLTYISYREPGFLWKLPLPFFWGPINGADNIPWRFFPMLGVKAYLRYGLRNLINWWQRRGSRRVRQAARRASSLWAVTNSDMLMIRQFWNCRGQQLSVTGTTPLLELKARCYRGERPLRLIWSGILEGRKALALLIRAIAILPQKHQVQLVVLGDGPERSALLKLANKLGVAANIRWRGCLAHEDAKACMAEGDVFVLTSIKEGTPTVMMEALELGLPVVCHDACGMAGVIDESCGRKIPLHCPNESVQGFSAAVQCFLDKPQLVEELSRGALERAKTFSWEHLANQLNEAYENVCCAEDTDC